MFLVLSKLLAVLADPVGLALVFFVSGAAFAFVPRKIRVSAALIVCGMLTILVFSSPFTAYFLMRGLETQYLPQREYGPADAVVLLGGFTTGPVLPRIHVETNISANRAFNAVRVYRQAGAQKLVLSGGVVDVISDDIVPEASHMFALLNEHFGIDSSDVIFENTSRNTRENAVNTKRILEEIGMGTNIILVTSANHMPRAVGIFRKAGFTAVTPAPTGYFKNDVISGKPLTWLPSSNALFESSTALREYCGIAVYKIMGWM